MTSPGSIENGVLFGYEGELFLAHGGHSVLDIATGRKQIDPGMFAVFEQNIVDRAALCKSYGARYLHVIFPDKQSVVRERFPFPDPVCLGLLYQQHCPRAAEHILNLTAVLREQTKPVFKKTDTHLNDYGLALASSAVVQGIKANGIDPLDHFLTRHTKTTTTTGDLGMKLRSQQSSDEEQILTDWNAHLYSNGITFGNDGLVDIYITPSSMYSTRLLWFGDSFGRGCVRLLSLLFREIVFLRTRFIHPEMVDQLRPDVVVTQNAERYLDAVASDQVAPPFQMYPALKQLQYSPSLDFATAFSALLSYPRPPYQDFLTTVISCASG